MRTREEIKNKEIECSTRIDYLLEFLLSCYKGSDAKQKAEKELMALKRERDIIRWVLNEELPF